MTPLTKTMIALSSVLAVALIAMTTLYLMLFAKHAADSSYVSMRMSQTERLEKERDALIEERDELQHELASMQLDLAARTHSGNGQQDPEPIAETDSEETPVFDELATARERLASVTQRLEAAQTLRDQAEHDTTMWRQQVERERRRAGTAESTQQDEDIAALSAELVEQAAANTRLTQTLALVTDRLAAQDEQIDGLVKLLSGLAREQDDLATQRQAYAAEERRFTREVARLEQLYADTEARREALARELAEGFDQTPDEVRALRGRLLEAADRQSELENARAFAEQSEQAARAELEQAIGELSAKDERIEELYRTIADLNENYARILRENYDLGYRLDAVTAERDTLKEQLDQMLQLPGPNLDKSQPR